MSDAKALADAKAQTEAAAKAAAKEYAASHMNVVTTEIGAMPGIIAVGTRMEIPVSAYSAKWMKPATQADAAKLKKTPD